MATEEPVHFDDESAESFEGVPLRIRVPQSADAKAESANYAVAAFTGSAFVVTFAQVLPLNHAQ